MKVRGERRDIAEMDSNCPDGLAIVERRRGVKDS